MLLKVFSLLPLLLLILSCRETGTSSDLNLATDIVRIDTSDSGTVFIIDYVGKEWDVTHAVSEYGFDPELFRHGLGPLAIRPILEPKFLAPGDPDYPSVDNSDRVIGTVVNDIVRAYPLAILIKHEIVDEKFGPTYVAVGY
jgi:hypothetical protein